MSSRWIFIRSQGNGSNWSDYMAANSGVGHWIVPAGTRTTATISGPTAGDSSTTYSQIRASSAAGVGTTQGGTTISSVSSQWKRGLQGGFLQYSNPYEYAAIGWETAGASRFGQANSAGWVVLEREQTAGGSQGGRQSFIPIEGTDGLTDATYAGGMPTWNDASATDNIVFFFDNYVSGDVDNWTTWDGSTTP